MSTKYPKKLIEVALPLDDINKACAHETKIKVGKPTSVHHWWARRPLAACRAVLFAQLVNDPGGERGWGAYPGQTREVAQIEREKLFDIMRELVQWNNMNNQRVLERARAEIQKSWEQTFKDTSESSNKMPYFLDPFGGGGAIPIEAQRLGLQTHAADLNPVAVMINKALIEIPTKFFDKNPVGPVSFNDRQKEIGETDKWRGYQGLAQDIKRYGQWLKEKAFEKIGQFYPRIGLPRTHGGGSATVIAWLWARTVASPNPAFKGTLVPLVRSFQLCSKKGKEAWVKPIISEDRMSYHFEVTNNKNIYTEKGTVNRNGATCLLSGSSIPFSYIRDEGKSGRIKNRLMAVVAEGARGRIYIAPSNETEEIALKASVNDCPDTDLPEKALGFRVQEYGMTKHRHIFTARQLLTLVTFSDLIEDVREKVVQDARAAGWYDDGTRLKDGGDGATAYGDAISVYLAFAVDRIADWGNSLCRWESKAQVPQQLFAGHSVPMVWDFAESNPFSNSTGSWTMAVSNISRSLTANYPSRNGHHTAYQWDASRPSSTDGALVISTDPPYYDNIGYADLSDFFYVWMRRSLRIIFPEIFGTLLVPKATELISNPFRHNNSRTKATAFFMDGMTKAIANMLQLMSPAVPLTVYYAFKQSDTVNQDTSSGGWSSFLEAVINAGAIIGGTWPLRTEHAARLGAQLTNSLASSIVLVCRKRSPDAPTISRRQFLKELDESLPDALETMIGGKDGRSPIAPVDLAQAAIGPGMAVYSRYSAVLNADGSPMPVREALIQINRAIDEYFTRTEGHMDPDTRFCIGWFEQYGYNEGPFGEADVLARAKVTSVDGVVASGTIQAGAGKVRILKYGEYPTEWDPTKDKKLSVWEALHHLIRALQTGEKRTGELLAKMPDKSDAIRQLAYRLYTYCERKGWAEEARNYNELIASWSGIVNVTITLDSTQTQDELGL